MSGSAKYLHVAKINWKSMLAYQADAWMGAGISGFRVLLAFLLWTAIFAGRETVGGFTLPMMITYALISSMLARLQHADATAWQLATEVREGQFSKYLMHPVWVMGYFISAGLGRWSYDLLINAGALVVWAVAFSKWLVLPSGSQVVWLVVLIPLGALFMLLFHHAIALLSLKYQDVSGMMILKGSIIEFLSGAFLPLSLLPEPLTAVLRFTPFYYVVYYPVSLVLGNQTEQPLVAALILLAWCVAFWLIGEGWFRRARKYYEGVGI